MRTVHINTERTWRGGEQQTLYLAKGLAKRGHGVTVVAQPGSPMAERAMAADLSVAPIPMHGEGDILAVARIAKVIRRQQAQIVHMHTSHAHTLGCLASIFARTGIRIVSRRVDFTIFRNRLKLSRFKYGKLVHRYVAISEAVKSALMKDGIGEDRISIVNSGIDLGRHPILSESEVGLARASIRNELDLPSDAKLILNVAHFGWHKAQEYLVRAAPIIREKRPGAIILLAGEGDLLEKIRAEAEALGVLDVVRFLGFRKDVTTLLDAADVFVMCSVLEGLCTSILDSLARRIPVVASRAGGMPEIVEDGINGYLVPPREPEALANAIVRVLEDPLRARGFGEAGRNKVIERFSVDAMVDGTIGVYEKQLQCSGVEVEGGVCP